MGKPVLAASRGDPHETHRAIERGANNVQLKGMSLEKGGEIDPHPFFVFNRLLFETILLGEEIKVD